MKDQIGLSGMKLIEKKVRAMIVTGLKEPRSGAMKCIAGDLI